jgi:LysM repeat protein
VFLGGRGSRWRCLLVWASGTTTLATVVLVALPCLGRLWSSRAALCELPLDLVLVDAAGCVALGCAGWAWLALSAAVLEAWRGVRDERRGPWRLPTGVRRVVLATCGVALASTAAVPAHADAGRSTRHAHGVALLTGLPLPDRAVAPPRHPRPAHHVGTRTVVVRAGDSLWSIAQRDLPPATPDRAVVSRWHEIYAANRSRIGRDPDLIEPGQRLLIPRKDTS